MDRYVGLDAHAQTCTFAVMGPTGKRLTSRVLETNGHALREAIRGIPGRIHLCLEEGTQSAWLYEILEPLVSEIVVTVPEESKGSKDDLRDAWTRANELRTGAIRTRVYKAPKHLMALRSAAYAYRMAIQDVVRVKNRLKAVLRSRGILAESDVYQPRSRTKWLKQLPAGLRELAEWLGRELDALAPLREEAEERLLKEAKTHPITRTLATAPGLGPLRTAQVVRSRIAGYAPSEYRLKRWPKEAQSGAWCPRITGGHTASCEVERNAGRRSRTAASRGSIPSARSRGLTHSPPSAIMGVSSRPSQQQPRARRNSILLTTHFSGADEAWPDWSFAAYLSALRTVVIRRRTRNAKALEEEAEGRRVHADGLHRQVSAEARLGGLGA